MNTNKPLRYLKAEVLPKERDQILQLILKEEPPTYVPVCLTYDEIVYLYQQRLIQDSEKKRL